MDGQQKVSDFEREYYSEIKKYNVLSKDLVAVKVHPKTLASEVYLRRVFGDAILKSEVVDDYDANARKMVEKVSKDKLDNSEFSGIMTDIEHSEFDDNLDAIIHSRQN